MAEGFTMTIPCKIKILSHYNKIEIIASIKGRVFIDQEILPNSNNEIVGSVRLEKTGDKELEIIGRIDIQSPKYTIDLPGNLTLIDNDCTQDIRCRLYLDPTGSNEYNISCTIKTDRLHFIQDLNCTLYYEKSKAVYDTILIGIVRYIESKLENDNEIIGKVTLIGEVNTDYTSTIIDPITGEEIEINNSNEILGSLVYEKENINDTSPVIDTVNNIKSNEVLGSVTLTNMTLEEYKHEIDPYFMHYTQHNEILGKVYIEQDQSYYSILEGTASIEIEEYKEDILPCTVKYMSDNRVVDLYCKVTLEKLGEVNTDYTSTIIDPITGEEIEINNSNEILGKATIERRLLQQDSPIDLIGKVYIPSFYRSIYIPCRLEIRKRDYIYSIFSRIAIPPQRKLYIPCRITVDDSNTIKQNILLGSVTLDDYESYNQDILSGLVNYIPGLCLDIIGSAYIDSIHTRREISSKIEVVIPSHYNITCSITVEDTKPIIDKPYITKYIPEYYPIPKTLDPILENNKKRVHITVDDFKVTSALQHLDELEYRLSNGNDTAFINDTIQSYIPSYTKKNKEEDKDYQKIKGKIVIAVSPTWNYEPYVFKNSLITFLDRYYRKADIAIVFGGSPRSDFDIINLSLNYKIRKENLCGIKIDRTEPLHIMTNKFIECMTNFKKEEYSNILRVFMFINQPNWYYNDPLSGLATYCKNNNISTVAISPGGEYCEILEIDQIIDDLNNAKEWTRQHPYHRTDYVNIKLPDTDRIVY